MEMEEREDGEEGAEEEEEPPPKQIPPCEAACSAQAAISSYRATR